VAQALLHVPAVAVWRVHGGAVWQTVPVVPGSYEARRPAGAQAMSTYSYPTIVCAVCGVISAAGFGHVCVPPAPSLTVVQIAVDDHVMYALRSDGVIFVATMAHPTWEPVAPVPGTEAKP
jgi:hypothetical protein